MAGRFRLLTDVHVDGPLIKALSLRGWDVVRAVDAGLGETPDDLLFEYAAREGRVLVTNDKAIQATAVSWLREGRAFPGLLVWEKKHHDRMKRSDFVEAFESLAQEDAPFASGMRHITPSPLP